jgi:hypothetical protein
MKEKSQTHGREASLFSRQPAWSGIMTIHSFFDNDEDDSARDDAMEAVAFI